MQIRRSCQIQNRRPKIPVSVAMQIRRSSYLQNRSPLVGNWFVNIENRFGLLFGVGEVWLVLYTIAFLSSAAITTL
jgi:hypothetical protein